MGNDTPSAVDSMARMFARMLGRASDFESFEGEAMDACGRLRRRHGGGPERFDRSFLDERRPVGASVHDVRERTLLCERGQVAFRRRRFELADGTRFCALDEALGLTAGSRVSPGAFAMVRDDALAGAYARAAELLCRHSRTQLSRRAVGSILREAAESLKGADSEAARDLFDLGLAPDAARGQAVLCVEADGTWPALQRDPADRAEVKAMVAYAGKEALADGRRRRVGPVVHYAAVSGPEAFWKRGAARVGSFYDLSALERVRLGTDGEGWCKGGGAYFRSRPRPSGTSTRATSSPRSAREWARTRTATPQTCASFARKAASGRPSPCSPSSPIRRARSQSWPPISPTTPPSSACPALRSARWRATTRRSTRSGSEARGPGRARACRPRRRCSRPARAHGAARPPPREGDAAPPQDRRRDGRAGFPSGREGGKVRRKRIRASFPGIPPAPPSTTTSSRIGS